MEPVVRLPEEMRDALTAEAERTGRREDEVILDALDRYLGRRGRTTPRSFGFYADPELSGAEAEDWLDENRRHREAVAARMTAWQERP